jgi:hypothetical protein
MRFCFCTVVFEVLCIYKVMGTMGTYRPMTVCLFLVCGTTVQLPSWFKGKKLFISELMLDAPPYGIGHV